jgi:uncharacterized membrane protein (DUF106 family)
MIPAFVTIFIFAVFLIFGINLCYKFLIDQERAGNIKDYMKELNNEMKEYRKRKEIDKMNEVMNKIMKEQSKLMRLTMKPMLVSTIIVLIFLPMLSSMYIKPASLENGVGNVTIGEELYSVQVTNASIEVTSRNVTFECENSCRKQMNGEAWLISYKPKSCFIFCSEERVDFEQVILLLPVSLPFVGDDLGWLGFYVIVSIPLMIVMRRLMKIRV